MGVVGVRGGWGTVVGGDGGERRLGVCSGGGGGERRLGVCSGGSGG